MIPVSQSVLVLNKDMDAIIPTKRHSYEQIISTLSARARSGMTIFPYLMYVSYTFTRTVNPCFVFVDGNSTQGV